MPVKHSRCRYGPMMYLDNDKYIGHSLEKYGEAHYHQVEFLKRFIKEGDSVIDVGANVGTITIPLAKFVGSRGNVISFEPQRFIYHILCGNVALNELENVIAYNKIVSEKSGNDYIQKADYSQEANFGAVSLRSDVRDDTKMVKKTTIDQLVALPSLIKIDVEGHEPEVLRGARKTIESSRPFLYVESTHNLEMILRIIDSFDYDWMIHEPPAYNKWSYNGHRLEEDDDDILKGMVSSNLICYHRDFKLEVRDDYLVKEIKMPRHMEIQSIWQQIQSEKN